MAKDVKREAIEVQDKLESIMSNKGDVKAEIVEFEMAVKYLRSAIR